MTNNSQTISASKFSFTPGAVRNQHFQIDLKRMGNFKGKSDKNIKLPIINNKQRPQSLSMKNSVANHTPTKTEINTVQQVNSSRLMSQLSFSSISPLKNQVNSVGSFESLELNPLENIDHDPSKKGGYYSNKELGYKNEQNRIKKSTSLYYSSSLEDRNKTNGSINKNR